VRELYCTGCVSGGIERADKVLGLEGALFWEACDTDEKLVGVVDEHCKPVGGVNVCEHGVECGSLRGTGDVEWSWRGRERGDCCILVGNLGTQHIDSRILFGNSRNELVDRSSSRRLVPFIVPP